MSNIKAIKETEFNNYQHFYFTRPKEAMFLFLIISKATWMVYRNSFGCYYQQDGNSPGESVSVGGGADWGRHRGYKKRTQLKYASKCGGLLRRSKITIFGLNWK